MSTDYGSDWSCTSDIDAYGTVVSGPESVAQALSRRLITPFGGLIDDPSYGFDLRGYVNAPLTRTAQQDIRTGVEAQCLSDERVDSVDVTVEIDGDELQVTVYPTLVDGETFHLTFEVSSSNLSVVYNGVAFA